jgi:glucosyl-3-phosphoglycerate phosphatase
MATLILTRHGESVYNGGSKVQGSNPDPANILTKTGRDQADAYARLLLARRIVLAGVWSSPLPRALETSGIVLNVMGCKLPARVDPRLREMSKGSRDLPGGLEGRNRREAKTPKYRAQYQQFGWNFRHGSLESGGETAWEAGLRSLAALNEIADSLADNATGLVVAHGQSIRYGAGIALGWLDIKWLDVNLKPKNCESLVLRRSAGRQWRFIGRLPASL